MSNESQEANVPSSNVTVLPVNSSSTILKSNNLTKVSNDTRNRDGLSRVQEVQDDTDNARRRHNEIVAESREFGFILGAKPLVQLVANPFVGLLSNK